MCKYLYNQLNVHIFVHKGAILLYTLKICDMKNSTENQKVVVFHTGRGGRFNNQGHKTCKGMFDSFEADYFGINIYFEGDVINDDSGNQICTLSEYESNTGTMDIDGDYDTYHWMPVNEIDEDDAVIIIKSLNVHSADEILEESGQFSERFEVHNEELEPIFKTNSRTIAERHLSDLEYENEDVRLTIYDAVTGNTL